MRFAPALALMLWAGVAPAQVVLEIPEETPPGYPPLLGAATGTLGYKPVGWEFYDFSVGAFDASAWVDSDWTTKVVSFHLMGYRPGNPKDRTFRLRVSGDFGTAFHPGAAEAPLVEVLKGADLDGPRMSSEGQRADVVIESIGPKTENSYLRHVTGRISARVCPKEWLFRSCKDISLRFETDVQMGSAVPVTE